MFNSWETWENTFKDVREWVVAETSPRNEGTARKVAKRTKGRSLSTSTLARSPSTRRTNNLPRNNGDIGNKSNAPDRLTANSAVPLQPSCSDIESWAFLADDLVVHEGEGGFSVKQTPTTLTKSLRQSPTRIAPKRKVKISVEVPPLATNNSLYQSQATIKSKSLVLDHLERNPAMHIKVDNHLSEPFQGAQLSRGSFSPGQKFPRIPMEGDDILGSELGCSYEEAFSPGVAHKIDVLNSTLGTEDLDVSLSCNSHDSNSNDGNFGGDQELNPIDHADQTKVSRKKRNLNVLQSFRWFASMHIICYHFLAETGSSRWNSFALWGATQLTFFFMLSGFILAYQYGDTGIKNVGRFMFKRWARLYPTYLLSIILQVIVLPRIGIPVDSGPLLAVLFCVTTWTPRWFLNHINTPGWSVGAFMFQYLLFPALLKPIARARQSTRFKKLLPACWFYSILQAGHAMGIDISIVKPLNWIMLPPHTASFIAGIVLGCCFAFSEKTQSQGSSLPYFIQHHGLSVIVTLTILLFVFVPVKSVPSILYFWTSNGMFLPLMACFIWLGALETDCLLGNFITHKPFLVLGNVSFTLYILQACMFTYVRYYINPWLNQLLGLGLDYRYTYLPIANILAVFIYYMFEEPAYKALLVLGNKRGRRGGSFASDDKAESPLAQRQQVSGWKRMVYTFVSYEWVKVGGYYLLMALTIGGYVFLSLSTSYIDWSGIFDMSNGFAGEMSINILKCCFFLAAPALLFGFIGHLFFSPAHRVKVPTLEENVDANALQARLFFRIVTRGKNPDLVKQNVLNATKTLRRTVLPEWQWKVEVATDNPLNLNELNDPQVYELLTPTDYVCPNGGKYKARALHYAVGISIARNEDWVIHLDEESTFDQETVKYIYAHCAKEERAVIRGQKAYGNIGQGVILYGCHEHPSNYLTTLADSIRVADDFGKFRIQYELHEPLIGMHGSFVVCQTAVEADVGFDHGIAGSITEDAYFALVARVEGVKFSWIDAFMYEQSPFNVMDFIRQRSRWFGGLVLVCLSSDILLKQRVVLCFMTLSWSVTFLVTIASFTNFLIGTDMSQVYVIATSILAGISCWGYVLGFVWTFKPSDGWIRYFLLFYAQLILQPIFAIMEMLGVLHGIVNPPAKGFYIIQKQADGNFSNSTEITTSPRSSAV